MHKYKLTIISIFLITSLFSQRTEKVYLDESDSTKSCYTILYPAQRPWQGFVVIIPGFGETAERVIQQTDLPIKTAHHGLLTVIPTFQDGPLSFGVDSASQQTLKKIILDLRNKQELEGLRFYIGGFSIGGSCAIKFTQSTTQKPTAVFCVDPPLDFERLYQSCQRDIRLSVHREPSQENQYLADRIELEFGGTPATALKNYYSISPYSYTDINQTAVKKFGNVPLRIYSEPDIEWFLKERSADLTGMNITDCSAFINELKRLGHSDAHLIISHDRGYRKPNNQRHPHSWSIMDNDDLIQWLLEQE